MSQRYSPYTPGAPVAEAVNLMLLDSTIAARQTAALQNLYADQIARFRQIVTILQRNADDPWMRKHSGALAALEIATASLAGALTRYRHLFGDEPPL